MIFKSPKPEKKEDKKLEDLEEDADDFFSEAENADEETGEADDVETEDEE